MAVQVYDALVFTIGVFSNEQTARADRPALEMCIFTVVLGSHAHAHEHKNMHVRTSTHAHTHTN